MLSSVPVWDCADMHVWILYHVLYTAEEIVWSMSSPAAGILPSLLCSSLMNNDGTCMTGAGWALMW